MITSEKMRLLEGGTSLMLGQIVRELDCASDFGVQQRALRTLAGMAKRQGSSASLSVRTVQDTFRQIGGFYPLVRVLNSNVVSVGTGKEVG